VGTVDHALNGRLDPSIANRSEGDSIPSRACRYERPKVSVNDRMFADLIAYAPGMNTSLADLQAVLEAEATPNLASEPGQNDGGARRLIETARSGGWQTVARPGAMGRNNVAVVVDAAGRYAYERTLPLGLHERVVCDGATTLHLYPELGVGARRTVTRFHR